ncbi:MAG TPA: M24 family metallopeptidase [Spirochaetia bacterium]|nr:M24 family metallopeptidase [Spirochaetia bacterium]
MDEILPLRAQAELRNRWLAERLESVLPGLMRREKIDMWIVDAREYAEDPVIMTLLPRPTMSAGRRLILIFSLKSDGRVERLAISRYGAGALYRSAWDTSAEDQDACLARIVAERGPQRIGLNYSSTFAHADGLTHTLHQRLAAALGPALVSRFVSAERLAVGWLERRTADEISAYGPITRIGHRIIAEAFSASVVRPGSTTVEELEWWIRQAIHDRGLTAWFQPTVDIQAADLTFAAVTATRDGAHPNTRNLILPGDLIHCDMGFYYLGLAVDQQQNAYVLRPGESSAPAGLSELLHQANRLQDIVAQQMVAGRTGNEILQAALAAAHDAGLPAAIYTHPLGYHGHAAGPTIGLWDNQAYVPGAGDYELHDDTCYAIELNVTAAIPEWRESGSGGVRMAVEEDAAFSGGKLDWLSGRQESIICIG